MKKKVTTVQPDIWADQETVTLLREMINEYRVYKRHSVGIEVGKRLLKIRSKKPYGFTKWCKKMLGLTDLRLKIFMLMAENPDFALESSTQAEFMRKAEPDNQRFELTKQFKPKPPQEDPWGVFDLQDFYWDHYRDFPQELQTSFGLIPDVRRFFDSYLTTIAQHNGDNQFRVYYEKLNEIRQLLMNSD